MSLLMMGLLSRQQKSRRRRARCARQPYCETQPRQETMDGLVSKETIGPVVKRELVGGLRRKRQPLDETKRKLYTLVMKEEWKFWTSLSAEDQESISYDDFMRGVRLDAVDFLNKALGISNGRERYDSYMFCTEHFCCYLTESERKLLKRHPDVKKILRQDLEDFYAGEWTSSSSSDSDC